MVRWQALVLGDGYSSFCGILWFVSTVLLCLLWALLGVYCLYCKCLWGQLFLLCLVVVGLFVCNVYLLVIYLPFHQKQKELWIEYIFQK